MRRMSFMLTKEQMKARTKTVTRRLGWKHAKVGMEVRAVSKCQGLKPGEKAEIFGVIRIVSVRREPLSDLLRPMYGVADISREGFPNMSPWDFIKFFMDANDCSPEQEVTRIEFEHL